MVARVPTPPRAPRPRNTTPPSDPFVPLFPPDPIPGIILGGSVNLFASPPNTGKTALMATVTRALFLGQPVFGHQPNPIPKICVISLDRSWHQSSQLWYQLAGWKDVELAHYCLQDDLEFDVKRLMQKTRRMEVLRYALSKLGDLPVGTLILIDPITPFLGGNLMDYDACLVACTLLRRLCRELGITIIGISHAGKQKNDKKEQYRRLQDRIVGSTAQFGYTDTQMYLASPEETGEPHYTFLWHPHHRKPELIPLGRAENGLFVPYGEGKAEQDHQRILQYVPGPESDGVGFGELVLQCEGLSRATVHRELQESLKAGTVERVGHGRYRKVHVN